MVESQTPQSWLRAFCSKLKEALGEHLPPEEEPILFYDSKADIVACAFRPASDADPTCVGIPDKMFDLRAEEIASAIAFEFFVRSGRKLDIVFPVPTLAHVEWDCVRCGATRLECKCEAGPARFAEGSTAI